MSSGELGGIQGASVISVILAAVAGRDGFTTH